MAGYCWICRKQLKKCVKSTSPTASNWRAFYCDHATFISRNYSPFHIIELKINLWHLSITVGRPANEFYLLNPDYVGTDSIRGDIVGKCIEDDFAMPPHYMVFTTSLCPIARLLYNFTTLTIIAQLLFNQIKFGLSKFVNRN